MRFKAFLVVVTSLALLISSSPSFASTIPDLTTSEYIVVLQPNIKATDLPFVSSEDVETHWNSAFNGYLLNLTPSEEKAIASDARVKNIIPNTTIKSSDVVNTPSGNGFSTTPKSWGLDRIDQRSNKLDGLYTYDSNQGQGVYDYIV